MYIYTYTYQYPYSGHRLVISLWYIFLYEFKNPILESGSHCYHKIAGA